MIDLAKPKSSIIRLTKDDNGTKIFQINDKFLKDANAIQTDEELKQQMYEVLRFNPFICESFYSDEVLLIEGPTEEIITRAYFQEYPNKKNIFILNCGTVTNIPFYQKIFSKFNIKYHAIFDTDKAKIIDFDEFNNPIFDSGIQKSIYTQYRLDLEQTEGNVGLLRCHQTTFEPAHQHTDIPDLLRYTESTNLGKPYNANVYWKDTLKPNIQHTLINNVPIIKYLHEMFE